MCNLYNVSPKEEFERYVRKQFRLGWEPRTVGPFQHGIFIRAGEGGGVEAADGQWGMIAPRSKARRPDSRAILTNNARIESIAERFTYRDSWKAGRRCLIPAIWYQEPNWETGKNIWWRLQRADGAPWALAGIWSEWTDPATGEIVPNFSMITCNCDGHPLLGRLHKPDPKLPDDAQDKRAVAHIAPEHWEQWLHGSADEAVALIRPQPIEAFDLADAQRTDQAIAEMR
ncbi:SOS response-associated peptidase family protein [Pelomonas sp. V22]|uniref:SOS response-associated peptidase n=1 Tax=Pelomonas sp. V22 TaxID=2822139 RepID=UPI0024A8F938|nr:SOS response-associated peptidase family protein [Pelomonas sp. V22]MDI4632428.1 SOS response-associated peptidase family protein [Pelomonas sp. V22]